MVLIEHWDVFVNGLWITIATSVFSLLLATVLGVILGSVRSAPNPLLRFFAAAYVEVFRNIPPLVLLFFFFFGLPRIGIVFSSFWCGVLGLALYHAGFVTEILRAGIEAVGRNQREAARALGLSFVGALRLVILPQAFWLVLPPFANIYISLFKTSALVATIGAADLMYHTQILHERTFRTAEVFGTAGLIYVVLGLAMGAWLNRLQAYANKRRAGLVA